MIMAASQSIWLLIPTGILLGNGVLFAYYTLTENWEQWLFLWPLEPLLIVGTVWLTIRLAGWGDYSRRLAGALGWVLGIISVAWMGIVAVGSIGAAVLPPK